MLLEGMWATEHGWCHIDPGGFLCLLHHCPWAREACLSTSPKFCFHPQIQNLLTPFLCGFQLLIYLTVPFQLVFQKCCPALYHGTGCRFWCVCRRMLCTEELWLSKWGAEPQVWSSSESCSRLIETPPGGPAAAPLLHFTRQKQMSKGPHQCFVCQI